jgi:hypothetical protein
LHKIPTVQQIQKTARKNISQLPDRFKALNCKTVYPVAISKKLRQVRDKTIRNTGITGRDKKRNKDFVL